MSWAVRRTSQLSLAHLEAHANSASRGGTRSNDSRQVTVHDSIAMPLMLARKGPCSYMATAMASKGTVTDLKAAPRKPGTTAPF